MTSLAPNFSRKSRAAFRAVAMASLRRLANSVLVLAFLRRIASSGRYFFNASGDKFKEVSGIEIPIFSNYGLQIRLRRDYNARYLRLLGEVISGKSSSVGLFL